LSERRKRTIVKAQRGILKESINFDRAASIYDATRKLPDDVSRAITQALLREIRAVGADRVLEVGIGTGRMARPLMREGVRMVGVDISQQMMTRLREQLTPELTTPDLLLGDATSLPIADNSFRAVVVVHVFHLVASVEATAMEIRRVLKPGGVLLHQTRRPTEEKERFWKDSNELWRKLLISRGFVRRERRELTDISAGVLATGATLSAIDVVDSTETITVDQEMERLRTRCAAWTWQVPDAIFDDALPEYEAWLRGRAPGGPRDSVTYTIELLRWD